jgi:DNA excision repair protein ERCC-3
MSGKNTKPLIVQSDLTLLLDVHDPGFDDARKIISPFAELEKSPEHIHTYRISPLSLWNAASAGLDGEGVIDNLRSLSRFPIPDNVIFTISGLVRRWGKLKLTSPEGQPPDLPAEEQRLLLSISDPKIINEIQGNPGLKKILSPEEGGFSLPLLERGRLKQALIKLGYPVKDEAPLRPGDPLELSLKTGGPGEAFHIRDYQADAARAFLADGAPGTGYGVLVLPCGAGKTVIGMDILSRLKTKTLILVTNLASARQWIRELLDKTTLTADEVGEYSGHVKTIKPVTIATYQIITWRPAKDGPFPHFGLFHSQNWGLIIYDEVHLLPAPVFRVTAEIQSVRRLGLTATLIREDGREDEVFSLVGPKRFDAPWKDLEARGWIAAAFCREIRVPLPENLMIHCLASDHRTAYRIACENPRKIPVIRSLLAHHPGEPTLIIGQYIVQLEEIARSLNLPIITGKTPDLRREKIYDAFRRGEIQVLVVSRVANFSIDLPDASIAIQVSGSFGSRQEEAQRLGRILRPKERNCYFYSLVSELSSEEEFSANRQKFLTEQGYRYTIQKWEE